MKKTRNRIKEHRTVRAGDLVRNELNWREHPDAQRKALKAILKEVGFARSLLAYELPDGRLKLIDGHLRADADADALVTVEILEVNDDEARKLLLTIDPLAMMAQTDQDVLTELNHLVETDSVHLQELWASLDKAAQETEESLNTPPPTAQAFVLIECEDENQQVELLTRFKKEGLNCRALLS